VVDAVRAEILSLHHLTVPELSTWLDSSDSKLYPCTKTWQLAKDDAISVFHTSGTTGLPKPIINAHGIWSAWDAWRTFPPSAKGLPVNLPKDLHIYFPLPALHVIGIC
jgi:acyl-coenzyme A synthetase/AMP-(fatty) acid ligase